VADEREFRQHKQDFMEAAKELGLTIPEPQAEEKMRNLQARAQEHGVSMSAIERSNLRRALREPDMGEDDA
jgi:hypothetical protein